MWPREYSIEEPIQRSLWLLLGTIWKKMIELYEKPDAFREIESRKARLYISARLYSCAPRYYL